MGVKFCCPDKKILEDFPKAQQSEASEAEPKGTILKQSNADQFHTFAPCEKEPQPQAEQEKINLNPIIEEPDSVIMFIQNSTMSLPGTIYAEQNSQRSRQISQAVNILT
jgi:uncharacterized protein (DUF1499 family)